MLHYFVITFNPKAIINHCIRKHGFKRSLMLEMHVKKLSSIEGKICCLRFVQTAYRRVFFREGKRGDGGDRLIQYAV